MKKIQRNFAESIISIGIDVDLQSAVVFVLDTTTGCIEFEGRLSKEEKVWCNLLDRFPGALFWACYEAGNSGYGLCRMLRRLGVDCQIVAPAAMPKSPLQRQIKNDRRDAQALAQLYFQPPRSFVRVPTEEEEAHRQLIRTRAQLVDDRVRVKNEIKSLLANYGFTAPGGRGMAHWSKGYRDWLKSFDTGHPELRTAIDIKLRQLALLDEEIGHIRGKIVDLSRTDAYRQDCQRLCSIPGVGELVSMAFLLEVYRPHEFDSAEKLASHLGLTQCEHSSGGKVRRGHITHWGPSHLRKLLVEAAWTWVRRDDDAEARFKSIAVGKGLKRALVAMARRLAICMWAMTVKEQGYNYRWFERSRAA